MLASLSTSAVLKQSYNSWHEVLTNSRNLNHRDRRRLIKKFKRSQKRRACAQQDKNESEKEEESSDCDVVAVPKPLSCGQFLRTLLDNIKQEDIGELQNNTLNSGKEAIINEEEISSMAVVDEGGEEPKNLVHSSHEDASELNKEDQLDDLLKQIDIEVKEWDNPTAADEPPSPPPQPIHKTWEAEPEKSLNPCKFYTTVGACRYFDQCKKDHIAVVSSQTILLISMFTTCGFEITERAMRSGRGSDSQDIGLEYTDENLYDDFESFAVEVVPELEKYGTLKQFKVCCNRDSHLRGNVYVEYETVSQATVCYEKLNGRFFDGKQLNCRFVNITNWHATVCGMHSRGQVCPRGYHCNYLHVFPNPKSLLRSSRDADGRQPRRQHNRWSSYDRSPHGHDRSHHASTHRSPRHHDTLSRKRDKREKKRKRRSQSMESRERKSKKKSSHKDKTKSKKKRNKEKHH